MVFDEKYFSQALKSKKLNEFIYLKKGNMTVMAYEAKFTELKICHLHGGHRRKESEEV